MLDESTSAAAHCGMTTERFPERPPAGSPPDGDEAARRALRVQLLTTEHWSLLATRSLSWSESFARANMFLTLLTGSVVALALVAQATSFSEAFVVFALLLLPVVLFVGVATVVRLREINDEDVVWVRGMNRLRRAYLELDPGIEPYLITGWTEDLPGILRTFGAPGGPPSMRGNFQHALVTTPAIIIFVDCVIAGVLVGLVSVQLGASMGLTAVAAAAGFIGAFGLFALYGVRRSRFWLGYDATHRQS